MSLQQQWNIDVMNSRANGSKVGCDAFWDSLNGVLCLDLFLFFFNVAPHHPLRHVAYYWSRKAETRMRLKRRSNSNAHPLVTIDFLRPPQTAGKLQALPWWKILLQS